MDNENTEIADLEGTNTNETSLVDTNSDVLEDNLENNIESVNLEEVDYSEMSDEDFLKLDHSDIPPVEDVDKKEETTEKTEVVDNSGSEEDKTKESDTTEVKEENSDETEVKDDTKDDIPYEDLKKFYDQMTSPFKAGGEEMAVKTAEDAIQLMQMGVGYNKNSQKLKNDKRYIAALEENGIKDEATLNYLISLNKGDPEAIKNLLKKANIDPLDLDLDSEDSQEYKRTKNYMPDAKTIALQEAVETVSNMEGGSELISSIQANWDDDSKSALADSPDILNIFMDHKRQGIYEKIQEELKYQTNLGYLKNVPYIKAYQQVGEALEKAGVFAEPVKEESSVQSDSNANKLAPIGTGTRRKVVKESQPNPNILTPKNVSNVADTGEKTIDYSLLSDEEFLKLPPPA